MMMMRLFQLLTLLFLVSLASGEPMFPQQQQGPGQGSRYPPGREPPRKVIPRNKQKHLVLRLWLAIDKPAYEGVFEKDSNGARISYLINEINFKLRETDIHVQVVNVTIPGDPDPRVQSLDEYLKTSMRTSDSGSYDLYQLWTGKGFGRGKQAFAAVPDSTCEKESVSVVSFVEADGSDRTDDDIMHDALLAIATNLGLKDCGCPEPKRCTLSEGSDGIAHFDPCSKEDVQKQFDEGSCLSQAPEVSQSFAPICGNSIIEAGEECDCGLQELGCYKCCNFQCKVEACADDSDPYIDPQLPRKRPMPPRLRQFDDTNPLERNPSLEAYKHFRGLPIHPIQESDSSTRPLPSDVQVVTPKDPDDDSRPTAKPVAPARPQPQVPGSRPGPRPPGPQNPNQRPPTTGNKPSGGSRPQPPASGPNPYDGNHPVNPPNNQRPQTGNRPPGSESRPAPDYGGNQAGSRPNNQRPDTGNRPSGGPGSRPNPPADHYGNDGQYPGNRPNNQRPQTGNRPPPGSGSRPVPDHNGNGGNQPDSRPYGQRPQTGNRPPGSSGNRPQPSDYSGSDDGGYPGGRPNNGRPGNRPFDDTGHPYGPYDGHHDGPIGNRPHDSGPHNQRPPSSGNRPNGGNYDGNGIVFTPGNDQRPGNRPNGGSNGGDGIIFTPVNPRPGSKLPGDSGSDDGREIIWTPVKPRPPSKMPSDRPPLRWDQVSPNYSNRVAPQNLGQTRGRVRWPAGSERGMDVSDGGLSDPSQSLPLEAEIGITGGADSPSIQQSDAGNGPSVGTSLEDEAVPDPDPSDPNLIPQLPPDSGTPPVKPPSTGVKPGTGPGSNSGSQPSDDSTGGSNPQTNGGPPVADAPGDGSSGSDPHPGIEGSDGIAKPDAENPGVGSGGSVPVPGTGSDGGIGKPGPSDGAKGGAGGAGGPNDQKDGSSEVKPGTGSKDGNGTVVTMTSPKQGARAAGTGDQDGRGKTFLIIVACASLVLLLAMAIIVVVIVMRRKKRRNASQTPSSATSSSYPSSSIRPSSVRPSSITASGMGSRPPSRPPSYQSSNPRPSSPSFGYGRTPSRSLVRPSSYTMPSGGSVAPYSAASPASKFKPLSSFSNRGPSGSRAPQQMGMTTLFPSDGRSGGSGSAPRSGSRSGTGSSARSSSSGRNSSPRRSPSNKSTSKMVSGALSSRPHKPSSRGSSGSSRPSRRSRRR